jgi:hypothetical protein
VRTVELAASHNLQVELTLFDGWQDYQAIEESESWVRAVLAPFAGTPEIAYIDLHNELPTMTDAYAAAWARALVPYVKSIDDGVPVTISASISSGIGPLQALIATLATDPPDLYDVHYYGDAADAYPVLAAAKQAVAGTPLIIGETGFATSPDYGWAQGLGSNESSLDSYQDYYFRMVDAAAESLSLPPAAPWILYDMPGQGDTEWGHHMGILLADGVPKPAASTLARIFSGEAPSAWFNNSFEQGGSLPAIWRRWLPGEAQFALDRRVAHSGDASARISHAGGDHRTGCPAFSVAPIATIHSATPYTASVWARGRSSFGLSRIVLAWSDSSGHYIASSPSQPLPQGNTPWTMLSVAAVPPAGASAVEIELQVCEDPGTTWFDDVSFSPIASASRRGGGASRVGNVRPLHGAQARRRADRR